MNILYLFSSLSLLSHAKSSTVSDINTNGIAATSTIHNLTDENASSFIRGSKCPLLVMFHADWCSACKEFKPRFEQFALESTTPNLEFALIDHGKSTMLATRFRVAFLPSLFYIEGEGAANVIDVTTLRDDLSNLLVKKNDLAPMRFGPFSWFGGLWASIGWLAAHLLFATRYIQEQSLYVQVALLGLVFFAFTALFLATFKINQWTAQQKLKLSKKNR